MTQDVLLEMKKKYPEFLDAENNLTLERHRVPEVLHDYIPYAELWGVTDDLERERLLNRAPGDAKDDLIRVITEIDNDLDDWLAGSEADHPEPSIEYLAFSAMRMAADFL